ncbi:ATP-binding cassette subfamily B protein [Scopulibacillus darangshiensis]|uniref:ATP-binding cassette subfamily B protein n=1 Tax=Scopulibacillus darangshiensis TaxID=442528 RepID=A0A4R2NER4_9BACL|nr:ABC transporter ATP-binding protein [Scopulibacillus darangshiensis]TCP19710.1 ATP-binding cassette subfamily B protein [Scopulibacillus darangshiensis]
MMRLFRLLKPHRFSIAAVLALTFLQAMFQLFLPTLMSAMVDKGIVNGDISYIIKVGGVMLLIAGGSVFYSISANFYSAKVAMAFGKIIRGKVFSHVENFSLQGFDKIRTSSLITRTTNDIMQVQQVLTMMLRIMILAPMMFIGGIIIALSTDAMMSLVIIASLPIIVATIALIAKKGIPLFKEVQEKLDRLNLVLREELTGVRVIRSFNRIEHEKKRFNEKSLDFANTAIHVNKIMAVLTPIMMLVLNFSIIAIIWFGSIRISSGHIQVGDLMAFIQYAMQIMFALIMSSMMFVAIPRASVSANRINEVLDTVPDIKDPVQASNADRTPNSHVEFQDVTFRYPGAEKPVISNISFRANPGEVTAIIGGTGAGKSTLASLIPRFYDIDRGSILVGGIDVRDIPQKDLRAKIGFVPQKATLFSGTIADNIRCGNQSASDEALKNTADIAQASDFISQLKDGFDSIVAQRGYNFSGGQKQRLSIARALIRKPEICIFDDSFSALDNKTEAMLRAGLRNETANATVLIVAQRVSTIMDADQIIVLDKGKMAGIGRHQELMSTCEVYQEIVSSQLSEEETA